MKILSALIFAVVLVVGHAVIPNANTQCKIIHGQSALFCHEHKADVCSALACIANPLEAKCVVSSFGAAEGTPCDTGKVSNAANQRILNSVLEPCCF